MKSFVLRLDPSHCDLEPASTVQPPPPSADRFDQLRHLWNAWNGKAYKLLEQESRIENLYWRRWHLEQKGKDMFSQQHVVSAAGTPGAQYAGMQYHSPLVVPAPSNSHFDRINEAGRQASRDLEAFLSNTLHNAQPPIIPNPPTFPPAIPPSPYSQLHQNLTNATPSPHPPHLVAPQPYRPAPFAQLPHQYQPSPEWAYNALPPASMPPPTSAAGGIGQNRIIATPSWTALISDSSPHLQPQPQPQPQPQAAAANYYPPPPPPTTAIRPPYPHSHSNPHLSHSNPNPNPPPPAPPPVPTQHNPYSYFSHGLPHSSAPPPPLHTPSFTLPPSATLFSDLPSALSSTPALQSAPLSFYSSYGTYQPIITPYPRFLTPSPEPSILGELELELEGCSTSAVDYESVIVGGAATASVNVGRSRGGGGGGGGELEEIDELEEAEDDEGGGEGEGEGEGGGTDQEMKSVWNEFNNNNYNGVNGNGNGSARDGGPIPSTSTVPYQTGGQTFPTSAPTPGSNGLVKRDPFEGMSLAQIRSRANSLEAIDRDAARYEAFGVGSGLEPQDRAAFEVRDHRGGKKDNGKGKEKEKGKGKRKNSRDGGAVGKKNKNLILTQPPYLPPPPASHPSQDPSTATSFTASSPSTVHGTSPTLTGSEDASPNFDSNAKSSGSKKNRNPHATQLPGNGQRKVPKEEAGEGHQGPICSHCGSITTPLWRRGPDDELLCNACGLYLKLHSKPRPKTFGKGAGGTKRALNGAAAKAAASGVPPVCSNCACTSTPMWRVLEGKLSCNACSLYFKLHKVPRPASLAQKQKSAAAAKLNLAADANPPSTASSPGDRPSILTPSDTSSAPTPAPTTSATALPTGGGDDGGESDMKISPSTVPAPLQPAVMPPPHHAGSMQPPPVPPSSHAPPIWSMLATSTSPFQPAISLPGMDPNPFAQTSWGALAYQLVSAAAEEEAGQGAVGSAPNPASEGPGGGIDRPA